MFTDDHPGSKRSDGLNRDETASTSVFDPTFTLARRISRGSFGGGRSGSKSSHGTGNTNEDLMLERRFGLRNEQVREFGTLETFSLAMSIISVSSCIASTLDTPLLLGGPASVVWCWALGAVMNMSIAVSIAELISSYPTSGGLFHASAYLCPKRYRALTGWVAGYMNTIGQVAGVASTEYALSSMIWAGVRMAKNGDFEVSAGQQYGLYAGLLIVHGIFNSLRTSQLAAMTRGFVFVIVGVTLIIPLLLLFLTPLSQMNSPEWVFTEVNNQTNYPNSLSFLFGLLSVMWCETDYDAVAHISYEVKQAAMTAPAALTVAVATTGILGFILNVALMFAAPPLELLPGISGLSFLEILHSRIGKAGSLILWILVCLTAFFCVHVALHANSRSIFAFSRDRALPDRGYCGHLSPITRTPLYAVWVLIFLCLLLGALSFVSTQAVTAVFSMCAVALDLSYLAPVVLRRLFADHEDVKYRPGPFSLGEPWSAIVNAIMVVWTLFACTILCFPTVIPISAVSFNWAWVMTFAVMLLAVAWFFWRGHKTYHGPQRDIPTPLPLERHASDEAFPTRQAQLSVLSYSQNGGTASRNRFSARNSFAHGGDPPLITVIPGSEASESPRGSVAPVSPRPDSERDSPLEMTPMPPNGFASL